MTTKSRKKREKNRLPLWNGLCVIAVLIIGVTYVFQMSSVTQRGYQMRELEVAVSELELESELLKVNVSEATSLANVSERMKILGFVEASDIVYLTAADSVAVR